jgi:hypothetical protein
LKSKPGSKARGHPDQRVGDAEVATKPAKERLRPGRQAGRRQRALPALR